MDDQHLKNLLQRAEFDRAASLVPARDLAQRVRSIARRRRVNAVASAAVGVLFVAGFTTWQILSILSLPSPGDAAEQVAQRTRVTKPQPTSLTPELAAELARLDAAADYQQLLARRMMALRQHDRALTRLQQERARPDELEEARRQIDFVAYRMILRADHLRETMQPPAEAIAIYQDVVRLFPTTDSAHVARSRLATLMP